MEGKVWGTNADSCGSKSEQSKYRHLGGLDDEITECRLCKHCKYM